MGDGIDECRRNPPGDAISLASMPFTCTVFG
jgi:hypothetical protein